MAPKKSTSKKSTKAPKSSEQTPQEEQAQTPQEEQKQTPQVEEEKPPQEDKGLKTLSVEETLNRLSQERVAIMRATAEQEKRARDEAAIVEQHARKEQRRQEEFKKRQEDERAREEAAKIAKAQEEFERRALQDKELSLGPYIFSEKSKLTPLEDANDFIFQDLINCFLDTPLGQLVQELTDIIGIVRWKLIEDDNPDHHRTGTHQLGTSHGTQDRVAICIKPFCNPFSRADDEQAASILDAMVSQMKLFSEEYCCKQKPWVNLTKEYLDKAVELASEIFADKYKAAIAVNMQKTTYLTANQQIKLWPKGLKKVL